MRDRQPLDVRVDAPGGSLDIEPLQYCKRLLGPAVARQRVVVDADAVPSPCAPPFMGQAQAVAQMEER